MQWPRSYLLCSDIWSTDEIHTAAHGYSLFVCLSFYPWKPLKFSPCLWYLAVCCVCLHGNLLLFLLSRIWGYFWIIALRSSFHPRKCSGIISASTASSQAPCYLSGTLLGAFLNYLFSVSLNFLFVCFYLCYLLLSEQTSFWLNISLQLHHVYYWNLFSSF